MQPTPELRIKTVTGHVGGPHLLITGGVHGDEFEPMAAVRQLATVLGRVELRGRVTLVPIANAAAFLRGARTAEDGLDMARTFPGRVDGSITERAAAAVASLIRQADFYLDLHTGGAALEILPLAGYMLHPDASVLDAQRRMARAVNWPVVWGTDAQLEGRSLSTARDAFVPAIYLEYLGGALCRPAGVTACVEGCLNVLAELGMLDRLRPATAVRYEVEDDRPGSGRLQTQHPAPMAGFFEPCVMLGETVRQGDPLGRISDALGDEVSTIAAERSGVVLALRAFPRVVVGDALAVVLELPRARGHTLPKGDSSCNE